MFGDISDGDVCIGSITNISIEQINEDSKPDHAITGEMIRGKIFQIT